MKEQFKLGKIDEETFGQLCCDWLEIVGSTCTTTFSPNNSGVPHPGRFCAAKE